MKILFVHDHILKKNKDKYYSNGGLSKEVLERYLQTPEDIITVYSRQEEIEDKDIEKYKPTSGDKILCKPSQIYSGPKDVLKKKKIIEEIKQHVNENDFIVVRIPSVLGFFVLDYIKDKKYMIELVACAWDSLWNHGGIISKISAPYMYLKTKKYTKKANNVVYVSEKFLQRRYPTKGKSISCSNVNLIEVKESILKNRLEKITHMDEKNYINIGLIGSLNVDFKGHYEAIRMCNILKKEGYKVKIHFLGNGNKHRWDKLINKYNLKENIFFDGVLPSGEPVLNWLDDIDIYIIPSLQEGLPRALIEAMSRACPSVGMRTGGIPELIPEEVICPKKDFKKLAKKIKYLINNKDIMKKIAIKNFECSKKYLKKNLDLKRKKFINDILK